MKFFAGFLMMFLSINCYSKSIDGMCDELYNKIKDKPDVKLAITDFKSINQKSTDPKIVQERITTSFSNRNGITVIERELIDKVLSEMKLQQSGAIDEKDILKIGELTGANYILTGSINDLKNNRLEINSRIIDVKTGKIIAGAKSDIEKDWENVIVSTKTQNYSGKALTQLAILIDTSNSMDGLIDQAKRQLWSIVNELSRYEKDGNGNMIEVALYEYGNNSLSKENGYIRKVLDFTSDMDSVSKELFALKTNGGDEYCGAVIKDAVKDLKWSKNDDVYKAIFIAGNEPFTQGDVSFEDAVTLAKSKGIFVNTIFCGPAQQGIAQKWKDAALLADGDYNSIDQNYIASIETPYDDKIAELNNKLNQTYIPYGTDGAKKLEEKAMLDKEATKQSKSVMAERASYAASPMAGASYSSWDLITAIENGNIKIDEIKKEQLPDELKKMKKDELKNYINQRLEERKKIRHEIDDNRVKREKFIETKQTEGPKDLGKAIIETVSKQATRKGYRKNN
jgi:TolB-like protein